jgi:hypothetical protein
MFSNPFPYASLEYQLMYQAPCQVPCPSLPPAYTIGPGIGPGLVPTAPEPPNYSQMLMFAHEVARATEVRAIPGFGAVLKFGNGEGMHIPEPLWQTYCLGTWRFTPAAGLAVAQPIKTQ